MSKHKKHEDEPEAIEPEAIEPEPEPPEAADQGFAIAPKTSTPIGAGQDASNLGSGQIPFGFGQAPAANSFAGLSL